MTCSSCNDAIDISDNYCRGCGAAVRAGRLPALIPERRISVRRDSRLAPLVRRSLTAIVVVKALEWTANNALPKVLSLALGKLRSPRAMVAERGETAEPTEGRRGAVFGITRIWQEVRWVAPEEPAQPSPRRGLFRR